MSEDAINKIFTQVEKYMRDALNANLPDVSASDLEKDGAIFYMNGQNGTAFDWYVNDRLSNFFFFYGDKENLGAVKGQLYKNGVFDVYVYGNKGHDNESALLEQNCYPYDLVHRTENE